MRFELGLRGRPGSGCVEPPPAREHVGPEKDRQLRRHPLNAVHKRGAQSSQEELGEAEAERGSCSNPGLLRRVDLSHVCGQPSSVPG